MMWFHISSAIYVFDFSLLEFHVLQIWGWFVSGLVKMKSGEDDDEEWVRDEDEECVAVCYSHPFFLQSFINLLFYYSVKHKIRKL
jgi:hypothetical protein